jgi:SAM-dependent methyltransferase
MASTLVNLSFRIFQRALEIPVRGLPKPQTHQQPFDEALGVETSGVVWLTNPHSKNFRHGIRYEPCDPAACSWSIESSGIDPKDFCFVDVGCGKARPLIIASRYKFAELIGVEYSPQLCEIARSNLRKLGIHCLVECKDAAEFRFPDRNVFVFLFNPFGPVVLNRVLRNLPASREIVIAYAGSPGHDLTAQHPELKPYGSHNSVTLFRI